MTFSLMLNKDVATDRPKHDGVFNPVTLRKKLTQENVS